MTHLNLRVISDMIASLSKVPFDSAASELNHLKELIELEKQETIRYYQKLLKETTLEEKVAKGVTLFPAQITKMEIGFADKWIFNARHKARHQDGIEITEGSVVSLSTPLIKNQKEWVQAIVKSIDEQTIELSLYNGEELPEWITSDQLKIELLFDEMTFNTMQQVIERVAKAKGNHLAYLRDVLLGYAPLSQSKTQTDYVYVENLNTKQNEAAQKSFDAEEGSVIQGPPGTGKSTTVVQLIPQILKDKAEQPLLVVTPTNQSLDILTRALAKAGIEVLRVGHHARIQEDLWEHTLEGKLEKDSQYQLIKKWRKEATQLKISAGKFKRVFDEEARNERMDKRAEAQSLKNDASRIQEQLVELILSRVKVFLATPVGTQNTLIAKMKFRTVIFDEAAQCLEPLSWLAIEKAHRVIFAGDDSQLGPTIKSNEASERGLKETLFSKFSKRQPQAHRMLEVQYRMHEKIMDFSNQYFYHGLLQAHSSVAQRTFSEKLAVDEGPLVFIDTAGAGYEEHQNESTKSTGNREEAKFLVEHLKTLAESTPDFKNLSIGIITPYQEQLKTISDAIAKSKLNSFGNIEAGTVDSFQGQERDVIYISLVRSNVKHELGFLKEYRRMNVALTRAKQKLIVIGDSVTLGRDTFYKAWVANVAKNGRHLSVYEYLVK